MRRTALLVLIAVLAATAAEAAPRRLSVTSLDGIVEAAAVAAIFGSARVEANDSAASSAQKSSGEPPAECDEAQKAEEEKKKRKQSAGAGAPGPEPVYLAF
jgi:Mg-chelatase subunit ChlI